MEYAETVKVASEPVNGSVPVIKLCQYTAPSRDITTLTCANTRKVLTARETFAIIQVIEERVYVAAEVRNLATGNKREDCRAAIRPLIQIEGCPSKIDRSDRCRVAVRTVCG